MQLESPAFENGAAIPEVYTASGKGISPPLRWWRIPARTRELALICEDPDAPTPRSFVHWIWYGIRPETTELAEGAYVPGMIDGRNSLLHTGYTGPNPPFWDGPHRYVFRLFALDTQLSLARGAGRDSFLEAIEGHILAEARLTGMYQKPARERVLSGAKAAVLLGLPALIAWNATRRRRQRGERREYSDNIVPFNKKPS